MKVLGQPAPIVREGRGEFIVWPADVWRLGWRTVLLKRVVLVCLGLLFAYLLFFVILVAVDYPAAVFWPFCTGFFAMIVLDTAYVTYAFPAARPTPGLYENGVQLPEGGFIPWYAIGRVHRAWDVLSRDRVFITLAPDFRSALGMGMAPARWSVPFKLVGMEGLTAMARLAGSRPPAPVPGPAPVVRAPELRVYGVVDGFRYRSEEGRPPIGPSM